ncbi:hypothetical protein UFOVP674_52 [uncultured Caudovirales phage]|uniref:SprT-like n=1 Tax=uncultured Caudovirales phage TaxID=2100421 RepID=A0A6J5NG43_9CAUD|nr:hypothetical protein UFOVP674_52 [uncultured Caudovirales phage]
MKASITIGGHKVSVMWADIEDYGTYCHDSSVIALNSNLKDDPITAMTTIRHELMHAALAVSGVGFGVTPEQEEQIVRCMESIFFPAWEQLQVDGLKWGKRAEKRQAKAKQRKKVKKSNISI